MSAPVTSNRLKAVLFVLAGVGFAAAQDAIVKSMTGSFPAYEAVILRCLGSLPVLLVAVWREGLFRQLLPVMLGRIVLRGVVLCFGYFNFALSIAAMPIANSVAIYFTMPFVVAGLAGPMLGERVRVHRWAAIIAGFIGVLVMVRPGIGAFEPAVILSLFSSFAYGIGQLIGRPAAQRVSPAVIAMWQNAIYLLGGLILAVVFNGFAWGSFEHPSLVFLARPWVTPDWREAAVLTLNGVLAAFAMLLFVSAYRYGETNFVAPFEYSSMVWAIFYGLVFFGDFPDPATWAGILIVVAAGILMILRDRQLDRSGA